MKKTSRRTFGRQLGTAIAALPLVPAIVEARDDQKPMPPSQKAKPKFLSEHNTPPPGDLMGGSLVFEAYTAKNDWDTDGGASGGRRKWSVKPLPYGNGTSPANIYLAHLKLIDGAGEMLFHFDNDSTGDHATPIRITATLEKLGMPFGDLQITTAGNHFEVDVPDTKRIKKKANDPPSNKLRQRVRYMHETGANPDECDWVGLKIMKGAVELLNIPNLTALPGYDESMRLLFWWENI
ncbi:MAG TPA: hypothetical protein VGJ69_06605 [Pyrinomonadaceae bacterium]|jgi:hypothetical protein